MIDWSASHISFVIAAYAIVVVVLAVVVGATLRRAAALKKTLADLKLSDTQAADKT
jgi:heme exporter protein CcmD